MKKKSPTELAERCTAKLHDSDWDHALAGRVVAARRRQVRMRAALFTGALVVFGFTVLGTTTWSEEQQWAAIFDETVHTVSWSFFSE